MTIDPVKFIQSAPPGLMIPSGVITNDGRKETVFLIREDERLVKRLGDRPTVRSRGGAIDQNGVVLVVTMFMVGAAAKRDMGFYECWWNYHATDEGFRDEFVMLERLEKISLHFFTPQLTRVIAVDNPFRKLFAQAIPMCASRNWSMHNFDHAKDMVWNKYPDGLSLWNALGADA